MKNNLEWEKVKWPHNSEEPFASWECWKYGKVILHPGLWPDEGWSYVAGFGHNDDRSHSGFLKGFVSIDSAKAEIESIYPRLAERWVG